MPPKAISFRLVLVCCLAASVGLPIALISLSKALLLLFVAGTVAQIAIGHRAGARPVSGASGRTAARRTATTFAVLLALGFLGLSVLWSRATLGEAGSAWVKHAKLLLVPLLLWLIRSEQEAKTALLAFVAAQVFLLLSSWMLWLGLPVPWASSNRAAVDYAVFSSRLDQPIMAAVTAAVCWHLRGVAPGRWSRHLALAVATLAVANVFLVMNGRTGHLVLIALLSLAIFWQLPGAWRMLGVAVPFLVLGVVFLAAPTVRDRLQDAVEELHSYTKIGNMDSSSGERLNYWHRSVESMAQHPLAGAGVGSWNAEYLRLDQGRGPLGAQNVRNPHQEYLLWGVEAGLVGLGLLLNLLIAVCRDAFKTNAPARRAIGSVLAALALSCLVNSSLFDATIGDFFCVALGLTLALGWQSRPKLQTSANGREALV